MGNIGSLFPSSDPAFEGADSLELLREASGRLGAAGYAVVNVDVTVIAERPKLSPYVAAMSANLAGALAVDPSRISVKGKTNEGVDSMGDGSRLPCTPSRWWRPRRSRQCRWSERRCRHLEYRFRRQCA